MARYLFVLPPVDPSTPVRVDTDADTDTPATITGAGGGAAITGAELRSAADGSLPRVMGEDGVDTLFVKTLDYTGAVVGDPVEVIGVDLDAVPSPGTSGAGLPIPATATIDTDSYDDTILGSGKVATVVVPADCAIVAVAVEGDAFPRVVFAADPGDNSGIFFGNGVVNPVSGGVRIGIANDAGDATDLDLVLVVPAGRQVSTNRTLRVVEKVLAQQGIGVGNSAAASTPGTVVKKMEVFNATGVSLGFVPIYDEIS